MVGGQPRGDATDGTRCYRFHVSSKRLRALVGGRGGPDPTRPDPPRHGTAPPPPASERRNYRTADARFAPGCRRFGLRTPCLQGARNAPRFPPSRISAFSRVRRGAGSALIQTRSRRHLILAPEGRLKDRSFPSNLSHVSATYCSPPFTPPPKIRLCMIAAALEPVSGRSHR